MTRTYSFDEIARLPMPNDNVAIAVNRIDAGSHIVIDGEPVLIPHTVMVGHRFAVRPIAAGEQLLSWDLPFGIALADIAPGEYVCNQGVFDALSTRQLSFELPDRPNFRDSIQPYVLDESSFTPSEPLTLYDTDEHFMGFYRSPERGVGTRNYIVILGTTSLTGSFARQLEQRMKAHAAAYRNIDGIVAIAHTEGAEFPNNAEYVLRTLAGFIVHPNVGAVLAVDYGTEPINNALLKSYMEQHDYPLQRVPHVFRSMHGGFLDELDSAEELVRNWLPSVNETKRTPRSVAHLRIALQCGGSDAFSGISGNPLAAWVAREIIRYGGSANLAETDELIGAEPYILQNVRDLATAKAFLKHIADFKERVGWHGHTAEGNPTGGNKYRGLYNINLKSIGAARKKSPDVRLDYAIDYSERMSAPGYYFMNSPGNDIESIAGQVASGSNIITFVTGNGSVTNFPFVPTIKVVTTTQRYMLLQHDMDINAGAYLDGVSMDELGADAFQLTLDVASGVRSVGERAGHSQVQLWRNWRQTDSSHLAELQSQPKPAGRPLKTIPSSDADPVVPFHMLSSVRGQAHEKVGLIIPTSLCSSEVGKLAAKRLEEAGIADESAVSRFVSLANTEGCGNSSGESEQLYARTLLGYALHPMAEYTLFLEHGCEKTHNDYMHAALTDAGYDPAQFGWVSIQLDGGIEASLEKVDEWFADSIGSAKSIKRTVGNYGDLRLAIGGMEPVEDELATSLAAITQWIVDAGGTVVVAQNAPLLSNSVFVARVLGEQPQTPTIAYGESTSAPGFHIMQTPTAHWVETLTGLAATGVELVLAPVSKRQLQTHPLVPVLQIATTNSNGDAAVDVDLTLSGSSETWTTRLLDKVAAVYDGSYSPKLFEMGNIDFQITRGLLGVTM